MKWLCRCSIAELRYRRASDLRESIRISATNIVPTMNTNAAAAIAGLIFSRIEENICRAKVR